MKKTHKGFIILTLTMALLASMFMAPAAGMDASAKGKTSGKKVVKYAEKFVGNPYRWGGNSLEKQAATARICCSGIQALWRQPLRLKKFICNAQRWEEC